MSLTGPKEHVCVDFPTIFGEASDIELFEELKERLGVDDDVEVFRIAHSWYDASLDTRYADEHCYTFQETGNLRYCVKLLLFRFRTEEGFSL